MRRISICSLLLVFVFVLFPFNRSLGEELAEISIKNELNTPVYKTVTFTVQIPQDVAGGGFYLKTKQGDSLPLELVSKEDELYSFRTIVSLKANQTEDLVIGYDRNIESVEKTLLPNFSGTKFLAVGSGKLALASLCDENRVKVYTKDKVLFDSKLSAKKTQVIRLEGQTVFMIESEKPISAFVSSLSVRDENISSDDFSSVFGTYFIIYVPRHLFISALKETRVKVASLGGSGIFEGVLKERGVYSNLNVKEGFYEISSDEPVNVTFGCIDDNVYGILYGSSKEFKGVAFGNLVVVSQYPETYVKIKSSSELKEFNLSNPGDIAEVQVVSSFADNNIEYAPVYVTYSQPVLIYSDSNYGNLGGEQIPSTDFKNYIFRTGKVHNIGELKRSVSVVILAQTDGTDVRVNGTQYELNRLDSLTLSYDKSHSLVEVRSNKEVSVFEIGLGTEKEFFSTLLPLTDNSLTVLVKSVGGQTSVTDEKTVAAKGETFLERVKSIASTIFTKISDFFRNVKSTIKLEKFKEITKDYYSRALSFLEKLSNRLIVLLLPLAEYIHPYVKKVVPQATKEQVSAGIVVLLAVLVLVLLLIPKKKKQKNIPTVSIDEAKKRTVSFNVKTLEESEASSQELLELKPPTIKMKIETREGVSEGEKEKAFKIEKLETKTVEREQPQKYPEKTVPIWKRKKLTEQESKVLEKPHEPKEEEIESKLVEEVQPIVPVKEEIVPEQVSEISAETPAEVEKEERAIPEKKAEELEETPKEPSKETLIQALGDKELAEEKTLPSFDKFAQPVEEESLPSFEGFVQSVKEEALPSFDAFAQPGPTVEKIETEKIQEVEHAEAETTEFLKKLEEVLQGGKEAPKTEESTFETLIKKMEERTPVVEEVEKERTKAMPSGKAPKRMFETGMVMDSESLLKVLLALNEEEKKLFIGGKVFISAKEKAKISQDLLDPSYKVAVIALTDIEERLAQDICKRIAGKYTTAEAILVARKIKINNVVVSDNPKITNYQGINVRSVDELI